MLPAGLALHMHTPLICAVEELRWSAHGQASYFVHFLATWCIWGMFVGQSCRSRHAVNSKVCWIAMLADAAEPASVQQQRSRALQLCSQLQRASLLAQQQQQGPAGTWADDSVSGSVQYARSSSGRSSSGAGSSTARTVLMLLESNRGVLDHLPKACFVPDFHSSLEMSFMLMLLVAMLMLLSCTPSTACVLPELQVVCQLCCKH